MIGHNAVALGIMLALLAGWFLLGAVASGSRHGPDRGVYMPGPDNGAWGER